jgi:CubicO group peptidase (beta-lactamase class C family)
MQSAGGLYASASDLGKWLSMNMNDGKLNGKQVIPADVIRAAHTGYTKITREPAPFTGEAEYGLGWVIGKYKNEKVVYHHGGFPGYRSHISYLPEKKIGVAVLVNDAGAGGRAAHVVATYAYDWWLKSEGLEADYAKQLQDLVENYEKGKQGAMTAFADRAKRPNQLSLPYDAYAGRYTSDYFGTVYITSDGNRLTVKLGNIKSVATNFTQKETIRVELIPGTGEVISFVKADDKISGLRYGNTVFTKDGAVGKN